MAKSSTLLSLCVCLLVLFHGCLAQLELQQQYYQGQRQQQQRQHRRLRGRNQCRIDSLRPLQPTNRIEAEAGYTEYWDENNEQLECAGVAAIRHVIEPNGLLLPSYDNAPRLTYIVQGRGYTGALFPGCPETYESFQQSRRYRGGERQREHKSDQHQRIQHYREGDIIALPEGAAHWCYNDGDIPLVMLSIMDTGNTNANQLNQYLRTFQIAGNQNRERSLSYRQRRGGQQRQGNNLFSGLDVELLADIFGVSDETARRLQNRDDSRGHIIRVDRALRVVRPSRGDQEREGAGEKPWWLGPHNGLEESICTMRLRENIGDPDRADIYSPEAGRLTHLNSLKLPILNHLQLSADRGVLYRNSIHAPHWHSNAHSLLYVTRGNARVQIAGDYSRPVFNGELREGQLILIPQNFVVVKESGDQGFEWVSIKTNGNAQTSPLAGRTSVLRGMPTDILANAFQISRQEANRLKYNRAEVQLFRSRSPRSQQWISASVEQ